MPLSEHEQRQLEQIEQALYADYPKLVQSVRAQDPRVHYRRRVAQAVVGFLLGVGLLLAGVVTTIIPIGVGGFVVMLISAMWALTSWRHMSTGAGSPRGLGRGRGSAGRGRARTGPGSSRKRGRPVAGQGFMERMEERWRRRQEGQR